MTTREQTTIRLPAELLDALRREAEGRGVSFNAMVIQLIRIGLEALTFRAPSQTP